MRDWLPVNHLVHLIVEAVDRVPFSAFRYNQPKLMNKPYHPRAMLCLTLYGYSKGVSSNRRLELGAKTDPLARYATANQQPDHSTIAKFQWENHAVTAATPVDILQLAQEIQIPRAGTISVDGTKIAGSPNQSRSVTNELGEQLRLEVAGMLVPAERANAAGEERGDLPQSELAGQQALVPQRDRARRAWKQRPRRHRQVERARIAAVTDPDCRRTPCRGRHQRTAGARRTNRTTSPTRAVA